MYANYSIKFNLAILPLKRNPSVLKNKIDLFWLHKIKFFFFKNSLEDSASFLPGNNPFNLLEYIKFKFFCVLR